MPHQRSPESTFLPEDFETDAVPNAMENEPVATQVLPEESLEERLLAVAWAWSEKKLQTARVIIEEARSLRSALGKKYDPDTDDYLNKALHEIQMWHIEIDEVEIGQLLHDFLQRPFRRVYEDLRNGAPHPRWDQMHNSSLSKLNKPWPTREDIVARSLPEQVCVPYKMLVKAEMNQSLEASVSKQLKVAINQIENRFFEEASKNLHLIIPFLPEILQETARKLEIATDEARWMEEARHQELLHQQEALYAHLETSYPERAKEIQRRRLVERVMREGHLIDEPQPFTLQIMVGGHISTQQVGNSKPMIATFELDVDGKIERVSTIIKFEISDLYTRPGVSPGSGPMREVVGAIHATALGVDIPPVTLRQLEGYGRVSVHERVEAESCRRQQDWYKTESARFNKAMALMAMEDHLVFRLDGASRNLLLRDDRLYKIDCGSDIPSTGNRWKNSAPLYMKQEEPVPDEVIRVVKAYAESPAKEIFKTAVRQLPENMNAYLLDYEDRLAKSLSLTAYPKYPLSKPQEIDFADPSFIEAFRKTA